MSKYPYHKVTYPGQPGIFEPVKLIRVIDGDTIAVDTHVLGEVRVRLAGINVAEESTPKGKQAKKFVERVLSGSSLHAWLSFADIDKNADGRVTLKELLDKASFNRWPGTIFAAGMDIRSDLLALGYATKYKWTNPNFPL